MNSDRREDTRDPGFSQAELIATDGVEGERELPVLLRDVSSTGIGAVYIGQEPPPAAGEFHLRTGAENARTVRLLWTKEVADYVFLLGLEVVDGQPG